MNVLEKIIEEIDDYLYEKYCIEGEDGISKIIYSHIDEMTVERNEGGYVFIADKDFLDGQKSVSKEFLQECKEVADKYRKVNRNDDWIPTKDRSPEKPVFGEDSYIVQQEHIYSPCTAYWDGNRWSDDVNNTLEDVIAWRYPPERYEGE